MSEYLQRAKELRAIVTPHYNCAQAVLLPFAEKAGLHEETAMRLAANFGAGMRRATACGAVTGGLMVLGLFGVDDVATVGDFHRRFKENHRGYLDCADLLRLGKELGQEKKAHCDAMVFESVQLAEAILREKGKL